MISGNRRARRKSHCTRVGGRPLSVIVLYCCALAVNPSAAAESTQSGQAFWNARTADLHNTEHASAVDGEQAPPQCEADLTPVTAQQSAYPVASDSPIRVLLDTRQDYSAAHSVFGQRTGQARRSLSQVPGGDSSVPVSDTPANAGNLIPAPSGYIQTVLPYISPVTGSPSPYFAGAPPLSSGLISSPVSSPAEPSPTAAPTEAATPVATPVATAFATPVATSVITPVVTTATTVAPVLVSTPSSTASAVATPTASSLPITSATPASTAVATSVPTAAATPVPTGAATSAPTAIATPLLTVAATPALTTAATSLPTAAAIPAPTTSATSLPTAAVTPVFTSDATPTPTAALTAGATPVLDPTSNSSPSAVSSPSPTAGAYSSLASPAAATSATASSSSSSNASPQPGASAADVPGSSLTLPAVPAGPAEPALVFPDIPSGNEPLITFQATFEHIPSDSLTTPEVAEVASSLSQALATYVGNTTTITTAVVPINAVAYQAPSPSVSRRHLLQTSGNTQQATVVFTIAFAAAPAQSNAAVQAAVQSAVASAVPLTVTTTVAAVSAGVYSVTVVFPPNNQVSTSTSQGTVAAASFLAALRSNVVTALPSLSTSFGTFSLTSSQLNNALVTAAASSDATPAPSISASIPTGATLTPSDVSPLAAASPDATTAATVAASVPSVTAGTQASGSPTDTPTATSATLSVTPAATTAASPVITSAATASLAAEATPTASTAASATSPPPPPPPPIPLPGTSPASPETTPEAAAEASPVATAAAASPTATTAAVAPGQAAPTPPPIASPLTYNVSVTFPPSATAAAQDLASTLYEQSDKALYAVVAANGDVNITNLIYGYQPIAVAPAPAPAPGPTDQLAVAPVAAAAPEASTGAAIESYGGVESAGSEANSTASGQLYAINMQYGVAGAVSNSSANLLMLALPAQPSVTPRATDFTVQLQQHGQTGTVTLLAESILAADFLIQVVCPPSYTGWVVVSYASPDVEPVQYTVKKTLLVVKVTASTMC